MSIRNRLLEFEGRLQRLAGEPAPREPLEVRQAVIQAIVDLTVAAGRGRRVLPFDRVDIDVLAPAADRRRAFEAVLARDEGLEAAARAALASAGCDPGPRLAIAVHYRRQPPRGWATGQVFGVAGRTVETDAPGATAAAVPRAAPGADRAHAERPAPGAAPPTIVLKVIAGRAERKKLELRLERINIGRGAEVSDRDGRLVRRNHLSFLEGDEVSSTVSRAHAHVRYDARTGDYRLRDDNSAYGTRVVREGRTIEVASGHSRGVKLFAGDELHFGRAVVSFDVV
jgi:pSer/pThr/pTyr-binding forkhead associated (FHA) protein